MKNEPDEDRLPVEKHNLLVCFIDKRAKVVWTSDDPLNSKGKSGRSIPDSVRPNERAPILDVLSRCIVEGKTLDYVVHGPLSPAMPTEQEELPWLVTMVPADMGEIAACGVCSVLPENFHEITEDEKAMLRLMAEDRSLKEVAIDLHRSESAINAKIKILKKKLDCHTIGGLVAKAIRQRII